MWLLFIVSLLGTSDVGPQPESMASPTIASESVVPGQIVEPCARCVRVGVGGPPTYGECETSDGTDQACWQIHNDDYEIYTCDTWTPPEGCQIFETVAAGRAVDSSVDRLVYSPEGALLGVITPCAQAVADPASDPDPTR